MGKQAPSVSRHSIKYLVNDTRPVPRLEGASSQRRSGVPEVREHFVNMCKVSTPFVLRIPYDGRV